jgi:dTMP kinase
VSQSGRGRKGRFIALEGGEASGKSTQVSRLAERLGAVQTREPGGTPFGAQVRAVLLDPSSDLADRAETLLLAADRAQHVAEVVQPALDAGRHVVTDRYAGSSLAYQGFGRGLPLDEVLWLSSWATDGLWPDLTVLLDVPFEQAADRQSGRLDRLEGAGEDFHRQVIEGFRSLAAGDPERWVTIDGTGTPDEVATTIWSAVCGRWPELRSDGAGQSAGCDPVRGAGHA